MSNNILEFLLHGDVGSGMAGPEQSLLVLLMAFSVGHIIGWIYMWTHTGLSYSQSFVASLVAITVIVALVMTLMSGNILIAFGLLAVFAVVRFRNVLKDTRDTSFVLWAIVEGMSVGTMRFSTATLGCLCVAALFLYLRVTSFGGRHRFDAVLSMQLSGGGATIGSLRPLLKRHSGFIRLVGQRNVAEDKLDVSYHLLLRDPSRSHELLTELESTPGVAQASLYHREDESEM